jgi:hypothetical protein
VVEERRLVERHLAFQRVLDGPGQLMRQHGQGFAWGLVFLQPGEGCWRWRLVAPDHDRGCRQGPLGMAMTALWACGAHAVPGGCLGTCAQTAVGDHRLYRGKPAAIMALVAHHEAEDRAAAGRGLPEIPGGGSRVLGGFEAGEFDIAQELSVRGEERELDGAPRVPSRISHARGDPITVGLLGDRFAERRPMLLAVGSVDGGQALGAFACPMPPAPEPGAGRAPGGGLDRGLREPPTAQPQGHGL